jgi:hypothetical protein
MSQINENCGRTSNNYDEIRQVDRIGGLSWV